MLGRLNCAGIEFATFCPLVSAVLRLAGVHFIPFLRVLVRLDCAGVEFATFCPLAAAVLHLAGVQFSSHFSVG